MEIDIILLGILSGGDFFGYEIMKIIKAVMADIAAVTTGTLYYKLKKLEGKGLLSSTREREGLRPTRQRYAITDRGRRAFLEMAMTNITTERRPYWPHLSSLFFVQYLPARKAAEAVRRRAGDLRKILRRVNTTRSDMADRGYPFHALLLVEHGQRHLEVDISWLENFARALELQSESLTGHPYSREAWEEHMRHFPPLRKGEE